MRACISHAHLLNEEHGLQNSLSQGSQRHLARVAPEDAKLICPGPPKDQTAELGADRPIRAACGYKYGHRDVIRIAIQQEIARSDESRYDHRLHGLLLVTGGKICPQVAELFCEDRRIVQRWVTRFESHRLEGLREGERPGRPATLDANQWATLGRDLRRTPQNSGLGGHLWDGKTLSEYLRHRYGVVLVVRQRQRVFERLGFRFRKPRLQVAQSDPIKVAAVKTIPPPGNTPGP